MSEADNIPSLSTAEFGARYGYGPMAITRLCERYRGFGFKLHQTSHWRIPPAHGHRLVAGETAAQIAATPSYASRAA